MAHWNYILFHFSRWFSKTILWTFDNLNQTIIMSCMQFLKMAQNCPKSQKNAQNVLKWSTMTQQWPDNAQKLPVWAILVHFETFRTIIGHFGLFWTSFGNIGPFLGILMNKYLNLSWINKCPHVKSKKNTMKIWIQYDFSM